jgi:hypothetical protein
MSQDNVPQSKPLPRTKDFRRRRESGLRGNGCRTSCKIAARVAGNRSATYRAVRPSSSWFSRLFSLAAVRPGDSFADCLRVGGIVLLPPDVRLHVGRRASAAPDRQAPEFAGQMM